MLTFYADAPLWSDAILLGIGKRESDGSRSRVTHVATLTLSPHQDGDYAEPTARLTRSEAQELMDALWRVGMRPSNGAGNVGQLAATEKHLEDMRRLVFREGNSGRVSL